MYQIVYHPLISRDFKLMPKSDQKKITRAIEKKLMTDPIVFGKPLFRELKNCYRLRIDPYRIIYRVEKERIIVFVLHIGLRKDMIAYIEAARRFKLIS